MYSDCPGTRLATMDKLAETSLVSDSTRFAGCFFAAREDSNVPPSSFLVLFMQISIRAFRDVSLSGLAACPCKDSSYFPLGDASLFCGGFIAPCSGIFTAAGGVAVNNTLFRKTVYPALRFRYGSFLQCFSCFSALCCIRVYPIMILIPIPV